MKKLDIIRRPHSCKVIGHWHCSECETLIENYDKAKACPEGFVRGRTRYNV